MFCLRASQIWSDLICGRRLQMLWSDIIRIVFSRRFIRSEFLKNIIGDRALKASESWFNGNVLWRRAWLEKVDCLLEIMHLSIETPTAPPPTHPGPRWGFDLTSLQILANSHPTGAYWLVKPPPRWGNLFNSLTDFINISLEFSTSLLTNLLEQKGKYDNRPRYKYDISRIPVCIREPKYRMDRTKQ